ncbi:MAG: sulfatase-like hydrolase/transferase [Puniceicoccaceae bacterium]
MISIKNLLLAVLFTALCSLSFAASDKPNVIIIYGDDVGFGDVGAYGSKLIPTPNIDKLAEQGLRFTDGHCSAATCSPSRFSMLTGVYAFRHGVSILPPNAPLSIPTDILTLPHVFKKAGYTTGVVGKWHLGIGAKGVPTDWNGEVKPGPLEIGFDSSFLLPSTNDRVPTVYLDQYRVVDLDPNDPLFVGRSKKEVDRPGSTAYPDGVVNPEAMTYYPSSHGHNNSVINGIGRIGYMAGGKSALWNDETMADVFVKHAKKFIAKNKDEPFFLFFSSQDIHVPRAPHPRFQGKTGLGYRGDAMVQFDWSTGEIMKALDKHGLTENTIVIFSSDNGPVYDDGYVDGTVVRTSEEEVDQGHDGSGIYRGGKYQIYEGGTRVPFIIRWPAKIKPGVTPASFNQVSLLGSFAALLDVELKDGEAVDSRNALQALLGKDKKGLPFMVQEAGRDFRALRRGDWKFIAGSGSKNARRGPGEDELYNLKKDPGEQKNVIMDHPEIAISMAKELAEIMTGDGVR